MGYWGKHIYIYFVVNSQYINSMQDVETLESIGVHLGHLNFEFECKCAVGLLGHFTRIFVGHYICLRTPIVVDSSFVLTLLYLV